MVEVQFISRYKRRKKQQTAIAANNPGLDGSLIRCFQCGRLRPYDQMRMLARKIWTCQGGHAKVS